MISPIPSYAAAWLQDKGHGLMIENNYYYVSCQYWDIQGNLQNGACFRELTVNPYFEYGALSKLTLVLSPFFRTFSQAGQVSNFGMDNTFGAARFQIWHKDWSTISGQLGYNQPFRPKNFGNSQTTASAQYALVNREKYIDARFLVGTGGKFDPKEYTTWYYDIEAAYRPFFDGAADELHIDIMFGVKTLNQRLIFELQELNTVGMHNPSSPIEPNYNLFTIQGSVIYWFYKKAAFQLGVKQDFYGINIGRGTAPFASVWWKF